MNLKLLSMTLVAFISGCGQVNAQQSNLKHVTVDDDLEALPANTVFKLKKPLNLKPSTFAVNLKDGASEPYIVSMHVGVNVFLIYCRDSYKDRSVPKGKEFYLKARSTQFVCDREYFDTQKLSLKDMPIVETKSGFRAFVVGLIGRKSQSKPEEVYFTQATIKDILPFIDVKIPEPTVVE